MSNSVWPHRRQPTRLLCPWDSPGRTLEWVAISFSNAWKWKVKGKLLSRVRLLATPRTAAYQAPPSIYYMHLISILISCFSLVSLLFSLLFYNEKRGARNFTLDIICLYSRNLIYYFLHCFLSKLLFQIWFPISFMSQ